MKIEIASRFSEALASEKTYEEQLVEAKASGLSFGTVYDCKEKKRVVIYHTPQELQFFADTADAETARPEIEAAKTPEEFKAIIV